MFPGFELQSLFLELLILVLLLIDRGTARKYCSRDREHGSFLYREGKFDFLKKVKFEDVIHYKSYLIRKIIKL